jgi:homogentisate 1,2-dioxygenase
MTFLQGVQTMTTAGDVNTQAGMAAHTFLITKSMVDQHFYNADGEMLFVPQQGNLFVTEFGRIDAEARRDRCDSARREIPRRDSQWARARLHLRKLRRRLHAAGARADQRNCLANSRDFRPRSRPMKTGHADRIVREMGRSAVRVQIAAFAC